MKVDIYPTRRRHAVGLHIKKHERSVGGPNNGGYSLPEASRSTVIVLPPWYIGDPSPPPRMAQDGTVIQSIYLPFLIEPALRSLWR